MILAVDFDGTLCQNAFPGIGEPHWGIIAALRAVQQHTDHTTVLWTCRVNDKLKEAVEWCEEHGLHFDKVNENAIHNVSEYGTDPRKVFADIYIDDKAIGYSPEAVIETLKNLIEEDEVYE